MLDQVLRNGFAEFLRTPDIDGPTHVAILR